MEPLFVSSRIPWFHKVFGLLSSLIILNLYIYYWISPLGLPKIAVVDGISRPHGGVLVKVFN